MIRSLAAAAAILLLGCGPARRAPDGGGAAATPPPPAAVPAETRHVVGDEIRTVASGQGGDCIPCEGRGFFGCVHCRGEGVTGDGRCGFCEGSGSIREAPCPLCSGSGRTVRWLCRICDGDGRIDCSRCYGSGHSLPPEMRTGVLAAWRRAEERLPEWAPTRGGIPDASQLEAARRQCLEADERRRAELRRVVAEELARAGATAGE